MFYTAETFTYEKAKPGDLVDAKVVENAINMLPPVSMRLSCSQIGEPYDHKYDPQAKRWRPTFATFKCRVGDFTKGLWE